jgi:DNA-binding LytR/AlgR family response regulator
VQLSGGARLQMKRTLTEWAALLPPNEFVRIGRSVLIHIAKLRTITSSSRNEVLVYFHGVEQPLRVGRAAASKLRLTLRGSCPA